MKLATLVRLALAGNRTDTARAVLTALSALLATLAGLAALTVLAIQKPAGDAYVESEQYRNALLREPGLRGGTAFALLMLAVPVLTLAGQCARLGAPARDRRLAALRLAGATPGQVTRLAVLETGLASLLGTLAGLAVYLGGRELLHRPDAQGRLALPTDVLPSTGAIAAVVLGLPLIAALATALMLRTVTTSPLGVSRRAARERGPRLWAGPLIGLGLLCFVAVRPVAYRFSGNASLVNWLVPLLFTVGGLVAMVGVLSGTGWISYTCGRLLRRHARRAPALLAAGRLMADPWAGSRTFAALLAAVIFGAGAAALRAYFVAQDSLAREQNRLAGVAAGSDPFYLATMDLVDAAVGVSVLLAACGLMVALVEGIVARRRAYAALVATGVPRATLSRSVAWQALAPAVPAILLALTVGASLGRGLFPSVGNGELTSEVCEATAALCADPATRAQYTRLVQTGSAERAVAVPLEHLAWLGAGALAAVLVTVGVGLLFLRMSTAVDELRTA
ncbi:FtsX-like permease family protein [Micromonospora profundi]|uniref:FtsX-like permease family protein n=1 Tax=Micromonospora profundi TaxID=1420889 RepID=A0AAJ6HV52_9ACTN|nr:MULTISPECIES: FtsX-like permease family protein [Micromonospora]WLS46737.1 FtsX-like permease family protein [Micromonospora profundi]